MKVITVAKILLDIGLAALFALLFNKTVFGGLPFHEIAGLVLGFAILLHLLLNWRWIRQITLKLFKTKMSLKTRIGYGLNVLLILSFVFILVSGILISDVVFPGLRLAFPYTIGRLHAAVSYLALFLTGVHLGLHWAWIKGIGRRIFRMGAEKNRALSYAVCSAMLLLFAFGSYQMAETGYFSNVSMLARSSPKEQLFSGGAVKTPSGDKGKIVITQDGSKKGAVQEYAKSGEKLGAVPVSQVLIINLSITAAFAVATGFSEAAIRRIRAGGKSPG